MARTQHKEVLEEGGMFEASNKNDADKRDRQRVKKKKRK